MMFSIIIATYNRAHSLPAVIESIVRQTYAEWELIIVDDGSTDASAEVVKPFLTDVRVRYMPQAQNRGAFAARNVGIEAAVGDYLVIWDSDDFLYPEALARLKAELERHPEYDMLYAPADFYLKDKLLDMPKRATGPATSEDVIANRLPKNDVVIPVRRSFIGSDRFLGPNIDFTFYVLLAARARSIGHLDERLGKIILISDTVSETIMRTKPNIKKAVARSPGFDRFLDAVGDKLRVLVPSRYAGVAYGASVGFLLAGDVERAKKNSARAAQAEPSFKYRLFNLFVSCPGSAALWRFIFKLRMKLDR